jgi:glycosyltransferase involved in cell wall biosynthesis
MDLTLVAPIFDPSGYAALAREVCKELYNLGNNVKLMPLNNWENSGIKIDKDTLEVLNDQINTNVHSFCPFLSISIPEQFYMHPVFFNIGFSMIETTGIPEYWARTCNGMSEIWVPSESSKDAFINSGVHKELLRIMPLGIDTDYYTPNKTKLSLDGLQDFNFLLNIEWIPRKCGIETVRAFLETFDSSDSVSLILKAYNAQAGFDKTGKTILKEIEQLKKKIGKTKYPPILLLPNVLSNDAMVQLYNTCDCVILASRGEGWGLPIVEGMACGKPYIATNWSGMAAFIGEDTGYPLQIKGLSAIPKFGIPNDRVYTGFQWADPDFEHLKYLMQHVYDNKKEAKEKGEKGRALVEKKMSWETAISKMYIRLRNIYDESSSSITTHKNPKLSVEREGAFVVSSLGKTCGIADYTETLSYHMANQDSNIMQAVLKTATPHPIRPDTPKTVWEYIDRCNIIHYQLEYGLFSIEDIYRARNMLKDKLLICTQHAIDEHLVVYNQAIYHSFDYIIFHSEEMRDVAIRLGYPKEKIVVIPMGSWKVESSPKPQKDVIKNIGSFGFCFPQKGWIETALAIKELGKYNWKLYSSKVEGHQNSERYFNRLNKFISKLDVDNIYWDSTFLDEQALSAALFDVDIILLPYSVFLNQYAISAAGRRCLSVGVPVICTDVTYFADLNDEVFKIKTNSPEDIIEGIEYIATNKDKREDMVKKSQAYIEKNSWDNIAETHINLWKECWYEAF